MTNEMKLLLTLCDALGFEVKVIEDYKRIKVDSPVIINDTIYQTRRLVTESLSTKHKQDENGLYETELINPEITYKLIKVKQDE